MVHSISAKKMVFVGAIISVLATAALVMGLTENELTPPLPPPAVTQGELGPFPKAPKDGSPGEVTLKRYNALENSSGKHLRSGS